MSARQILTSAAESSMKTNSLTNHEVKNKTIMSNITMLKHTDFEERRKNILNFVVSRIQNLELGIKQRIVDESHAANNMSQGDGSGLGGGFLVDKNFISNLCSSIPNFSPHYKGESDLVFDFVLFINTFSFKKINGKSQIALDWSKNPNKTNRCRFTSDIIILNLRGQQWWKQGPNKGNKDIDYTQYIEKGVYVIDKEFCKKNIELSENNKTDTLIKDQQLYEMLVSSINRGRFVKLPEVKKKLIAELSFREV